MAIKNFKPMECPVCHEYYFTDDTELEIPFKEVRKANLVYDFKDI